MGCSDHDQTRRLRIRQQEYGPRQTCGTQRSSMARVRASRCDDERYHASDVRPLPNTCSPGTLRGTEQRLQSETHLLFTTCDLALAPNYNMVPVLILDVLIPQGQVRYPEAPRRALPDCDASDGKAPERPLRGHGGQTLRAGRAVGPRVGPAEPAMARSGNSMEPRLRSVPGTQSCLLNVTDLKHRPDKGPPEQERPEASPMSRIGRRWTMPDW